MPRSKAKRMLHVTCVTHLVTQLHLNFTPSYAGACQGAQILRQVPQEAQCRTSTLACGAGASDSQTLVFERPVATKQLEDIPIKVLHRLLEGYNGNY